MRRRGEIEDGEERLTDVDEGESREAEESMCGVWTEPGEEEREVMSENQATQGDGEELCTLCSEGETQEREEKAREAEGQRNAGSVRRERLSERENDGGDRQGEYRASDREEEGGGGGGLVEGEEEEEGNREERRSLSVQRERKPAVPQRVVQEEGEERAAMEGEWRGTWRVMGHRQRERERLRPTEAERQRERQANAEQR